MDITSLGALTRDEHFLRFVALLSVPQSAGWRIAHPTVPSVRSTLDRLMKLSKGLPAVSHTFATEFNTMLVNITGADESLHYSTEDYTWIIEAADSEDAPLIFSLLFAYAVCPVRWYTAEQVAEFSDRAPSTWRKFAAEGRIIGAKKIGESKTWLFPESGLVAFGVKLPPPMQMEIEEVSEDAGNQNSSEDFS